MPRGRSVHKAKRRVGSGLFIMGVGQYFPENFYQKLQQVIGTVVGCEWGYLTGGVVLIGVGITFINLHYWITAAVEQMSEPS